jgi:hypothetical protein
MPFLGAVGSPEKYLAERKKELRRRRTAKMPALARHLGIDVDRFNLSPENGLGWMMLYAVIAERLTEELIPGFQEKSRGSVPQNGLRSRHRRTAADLVPRSKLHDARVADLAVTSVGRVTWM